MKTSPLLGVNHSLTGRRWERRSHDEQVASALAHHVSLSDFLGCLMAGRGITPETAQDYLHPSLRHTLPDPYHLKDMDQAVARLLEAARSGERVAIFGDYDVDGATSSALLARFFTAVAIDHVVYIPDRLKEGYGPNLKALQQLKARGVSVVVTVDCGIVAFDCLDEASSFLDVIVVDHHSAQERLPRAVAVVNPNRLDDSSSHGHMAAVGVCFLLAVAVNTALREAGYYTQGRKPNLTEPNLNLTDPNLNLKEPNLNLKEPDLNLKEPNPNLKEPNPNLKEPNPNLTEPNLNLKEPDLNLKEPNPNLKEPNPNLKEPNLNLKEPDLNLKEPDLNLKEPNPNLTEPNPNLKEPNLNLKEPDLFGLLDLVALGTVCDVVPLRGVNRTFVSQGLKVMKRGQNLGVSALSQVAGSREIDTYHLGFVLGPRVNAGGRVGRSSLGSELLRSTDLGTSLSMAQELDMYNRERKEIEQTCLQEALSQAEGQDSFIYVSGVWHPGVVGLVASRLKDLHGCPACVVAYDGTVGRGSARSVRGFNMGAAVAEAVEEALLVGGGGHKMAAGFTVDKSCEEQLKSFLKKKAQGCPRPSLRVDEVLSLSAGTTALVDELALMTPFGVDNEEPRFAFPDVQVTFSHILKESHVKVRLSKNGHSIDALAFRSADKPLGQGLLQTGKFFHVVGYLRVNTWRQRRTPQIIIEDATWA